MALTQRAQNEITHDAMLAQADAEAIWGWGTPAGRLRAERRARLITEGAGLRPGNFPTRRIADNSARRVHRLRPWRVVSAS